MTRLNTLSVRLRDQRTRQLNKRFPVAALFLAGTIAAHAWAQRPEDLSFSAERLARIGAAYRAEIDRGTTRGAVTLVARDGRVVYHEAHGYLDQGKSRPMPKDAIFRMFSMTKPITSVATMMLVEQGRLRLSDPIDEWLPEFKEVKVMVERRDANGAVTHEIVPAARRILVQDLLRHTSGLSHTGAPFEPLRAAYKAAGMEWGHFGSSDEFIARLAALPLAYQPGAKFHYGESTDALGVLLERLTGKRLDALLEEMIFRPLGMKDTRFDLDAPRRDRLAAAPTVDPGLDWLAVELDPARTGVRRGGSGAVSTALDYFRFCQMLLNGGELDGVRLLGRKTVEQMFADQLQEPYPQMPISGAVASFIQIGATREPGSAGPSGFGLGFGVKRRDGYGAVPGSAGQVTWASYGGSTFLIDPKEGIIAIGMAESPSGWRRLMPMLHQVVWGAVR